MNVMNKLISKLISEAPPENKGALMCQVTFKNAPKEAMTVGGALRKVEGFDDLLQMTVIGTAQQSPQSPPQAFQAEIYFEADAILRVEVVKTVESSGLIIPNGGNGKVIPPGLRSL